MNKKTFLILNIILIGFSSCKTTNFTYKAPRNDVGFGVSTYSHGISKPIMEGNIWNR